MSVGLDPPGTGLTTLLCFPVLRPRLSLTPKDFRPISGNPATELYQNICFGHSLSIIITGQLPLYYGKNSKSNLRTLLGWLEYFVAPPANTCAQQRLQTRWGRRGLGGGGRCGVGKAWCGAGRVGKAWLVGPESPSTNLGSCCTFLIWTGAVLNCVLL